MFRAIRWQFRAPQTLYLSILLMYLQMLMDDGRVKGVRTARVHSVRNLTADTYVLRFDRHDMAFEPGQYLSVGPKDDVNMREYSIYSALDDDYLEVLVREVRTGYVSRELRSLHSGSMLKVEGPFGFFTIHPRTRATGKLMFVATGTGISPFSCIVRSYPGLECQLVHGIRWLNEQYEYSKLEISRITSCISREDIGSVNHNDNGSSGSAQNSRKLFSGRVTDYLRQHPPSPDTYCYLCGNCDMIYESFDILKKHGVPVEHVFAEVYY